MAVNLPPPGCGVCAVQWRTLTSPPMRQQPAVAESKLNRDTDASAQMKRDTQGISIQDHRRCGTQFFPKSSGVIVPDAVSLS